MPESIILLTRGSPLALKQAELSARVLRDASGARVSIRTLTTTGDHQQAWSLEKAGGAGLFTSELENALRSGMGDIAVHSAKDLPSATAPGLTLAGCLSRANPADVFVRREEAGVFTAGGESAVIATGSPRRRAQARLRFPKARFTQLRGNVETRLRKVAAGEASATFLAAAGLERLGIGEWPGLVFEPWSLTDMVPAAGQGAIAWEVRDGDVQKFASFCDPETSHAVAVERAFLARLGAGCHSAFACHLRDEQLFLFHESLGYHTFAFPALSPLPLTSRVDAILARMGGVNIPCNPPHPPPET
ncbi:MAG: hydroxymethylbilane synthase [Puniceicoccales bacterium]|jgi:hydroxymethylbilane synthase|nr:hydroxymethylbilane synthase [Puniceicoccales bacterium]